VKNKKIKQGIVMYIIGDATKMLMRGLLLCMLYGAAVSGMDHNPHKILELIVTMPQGENVKEGLRSYFLGAPRADRWFSHRERPTCVVPLEKVERREIEEHNSINILTYDSVLTSCAQRYADKGKCTYATQWDNDLLVGFADGSVLVEDKSGHSDFYALDRNKPVSACALGHSNSICSYPNSRSILIGHPDGSLELMDRRHRKYSGFHAHCDAILYMAAGHLPNMWIIGGKSAITIMRFIQNVHDEEVSLERYQICFNANDANAHVQGIGLYRCGLFIKTAHGARICMPYSFNAYKAISEWHFSPEQTECVERIIATRKLGMTAIMTAREQPHFEKLPEEMQEMLLESSE
jgi:hypothetical protein